MSEQQTQTLQSNCEQIRELIPAYSMGITDEDETALVESVLAECPQAQADLAEFRQLAGEMAQSVPQVMPPEHLRDQILLVAEASATHPTRHNLELPVASRIVRFNWARLVAAAVVVILLAINALMLVQITDLQDRQDSLEDEVSAQVELLTHFATDNVAEFVLYDPSDGSALDEKNYKSKGRILCNPDSNVGVIRAEGFPPLAADQTYQVWLNREDERTSGGLFTVDDAGDGTYVFRSPLPMGSYDYIGISPEPSGGSDAPTAPPVARGSLY